MRHVSTEGRSGTLGEPRRRRMGDVHHDAANTVTAGHGTRDRTTPPRPDHSRGGMHPAPRSGGHDATVSVRRRIGLGRGARHNVSRCGVVPTWRCLQTARPASVSGPADTGPSLADGRFHLESGCAKGRRYVAQVGPSRRMNVAHADANNARA